MQKDIQTVPLGVDLAHIYGTTPAAEKSDVIFVGRLLAHKNVDALIKAIALVKKSKSNVRCLIVGNGPEKEALETLIDTLDLQAHVQILSGVESSSEVYALMKASKMLVSPSVREGFGLVAVEANAAGIPVITSNHPDNATRTLIHQHNGVVVEPEAEAIARQIRAILRTRGAMEPALNLEQYDWQVVAGNIERSYGL